MKLLPHKEPLVSFDNQADEKGGGDDAGSHGGQSGRLPPVFLHEEGTEA